MGKTARWFRGLLGGTKNDNTTTSSVGDGSKPPTSTKKRWSFVKSFRDKDRCAPSHPTQLIEQQRRGSYREGAITSPYLDATVDPNKHAIAVAAATAAVAEAAVAAAQAAAAVVKLTSSGRCTSAYVSGVNGVRRDDDLAAVKIQAAFRGYLARRALHALKGLVKLQALVRGHIVRKGTAETMRCMQALVRVQARARAGRSYISETLPPNIKPSISHNPGPATPEKYERTVRTNSTRRDRGSTLKRNWSRPNSRDGHDMTRVHMGRNHLDHRMDEQWDYRKETRVKTGPTDDEKSDKILEIDPGKPHFNTKGWNALQLSQSFTTVDSPSKDSTTAQLSTSSTSSGEVQSVNPCRSQLEIGDEAFSTAQNSPQFYSASSMCGNVKRGPFTPTTSDCSRSFLSGYSDHPNYMANTESSTAKVRSQSAPKQRLGFEKSSSTKRHSYGAGDARSSAQRASATLHADFASKAYPGSGRLDRLGMPIRSETVGYSGGYRTRY